MRRTNLSMWLQTALLIAACLTILVNSAILRSPLIGIPAALVILFFGALSTGKIFFRMETTFLKIALGMMGFLTLTALVGVVLILLANYSELPMLYATVSTVTILYLISARRRSSHEQSTPRLKDTGRGRAVFYAVSSAFLLLSAYAFYLLFLSRTGEGTTSVWLTIPDIFLPVVLTAFMLLLTALFLKVEKSDTKLVLVLTFSVLVHALFIIVWYPGRYGDIWQHLGEETFIDSNAAPYAYAFLLQKLYVIDILGSKAQYALVIFFKRLFLVDLYWAHIAFIPLMWSFFVPLFSFKTGQILAPKRSTSIPLISAIGTALFPSLVYWGTSSVPNSLGFIFLFFSIMLLFCWVKNKERRFWFLSLASCVAASLAHPLPGIFAFIFLFGMTVVQSKLSAFIKAISYALFLSLYPLALYFLKATFSAQPLFIFENIQLFQQAILTVPFVIAFLGLLLSVRSMIVEHRNVALLFLFYLTAISCYYATEFGIQNLPFGADRLIPIADFLLVPFLAIGTIGAISLLNRAFSRVRTPISRQSRKSYASYSASVLIAVLLLASQVGSAVYEAYPRDEITKIQPAYYEIDAVRYINLATSERYVVLGDTNFASIAIGFLGVEYGYGGDAQGMFGIPEWEWWTAQLYLQMARSPSVSIMKEAMLRAGATRSYFVVSVRDPEFDSVVERTSEILPEAAVFGNGKLHIFAYPSPLITGTGPPVKVVFGNGTSVDAQTKSAYISRSEVYYTLTLSGSSSYNVTSYPLHWTFLNMTVNTSSKSPSEFCDINYFIYEPDRRPDDVLIVTWQANDLYPIVGWKDDSFKSGWQTHPIYGGTISPEVTTDGNFLNLSWSFVPGSYQYYYYIKNVAVPTNDYPYILVRWRSTGPVAVIAVAYKGSEAIQEPVVAFNSESYGWTNTIVSLRAGEEIAYVMVGITNVSHQDITGPMLVSLDYIMLCGK